MVRWPHWTRLCRRSSVNLRTRYLSVLAATVLLGAGAAHGRTLAEIRSTGELRVCVAGSSIDFYRTNAEEFAKYLGVQFKSRTLPSWDSQFFNAEGALQMTGRYEAAPLASGQCDLYPNDLHITPWRAQRMALVPYFSTRSVVVSRPEMRAVLHEAADLAGRTAVAQSGTTYEGWLRTFNATGKHMPIEVHLAPTADAMRAVAERRIDFTVIAAEAALKWVRDDRENLELLFPVGAVTQVGWGISHNTPDLEQALQAFFAENRRVDSGLDASWRRQYGISLIEYQLFTAAFDTGPRLRERLIAWSIPAGFALATLLLAMTFRARHLRREVKQQAVAVRALRESQALMRGEVSRGKAVSNLLLGLQLVEDLEAFGQVTLRELARHLPLGQGLIALVDGDGQVRALAHYAGAGATPAQTLDAFPTTSGLMARCVATAEPVMVTAPGPEYLRIRSGLGNCVPACILLVPVRHAGEVIAVIEMATTQSVTQEQRDLLAALEPIVATGIHRLQKEEELAAAHEQGAGDAGA